MKLRSGQERKRARVEMLPLIDIVFLLLVFFIYAMLSMVVHRGVKVRLPRAGTAQTDRREYLSISITRDNELYLGKERVEFAELARRVRRAQQEEEKPVFISGDVQSDFGLAVRVLDELRRIGVEQVSFESREEGR
jgi:biopolymer transport protein ExbD